MKLHVRVGWVVSSVDPLSGAQAVSGSGKHTPTHDNAIPQLTETVAESSEEHSVISMIKQGTEGRKQGRDSGNSYSYDNTSDSNVASGMNQNSGYGMMNYGLAVGSGGES